MALGKRPIATGPIAGQFPQKASAGAGVFTTETPASPSVTDGVPYELGMKFQVAVAGKINGIRYYKASNEPANGQHVGRIWTSGGTLLRSVTFVNETTSGWQTATFDPPLAVSAATTYVVSVNVASYYAVTASGLASAITNGNVSSVADGSNGVFNTTPGSFPTTSFGNGNYFRDVFFVADAAGSNAGTASTGQGGQTSVATATQINAGTAGTGQGGQSTVAAATQANAGAATTGQGGQSTAATATQANAGAATTGQGSQSTVATATQANNGAATTGQGSQTTAATATQSNAGVGATGQGGQSTTASGTEINAGAASSGQGGQTTTAAASQANAGTVATAQGGQSTTASSAAVNSGSASTGQGSQSTTAAATQANAGVATTGQGGQSTTAAGVNLGANTGTASTGQGGQSTVASDGGVVKPVDTGTRTGTVGGEAPRRGGGKQSFAVMDFAEQKRLARQKRQAVQLALPLEPDLTEDEELQMIIQLVVGF